jgi:hypothetical protein
VSTTLGVCYCRRWSHQQEVGMRTITAFVKDEVPKWAKAVKDSGAKVD